MPKIAFDLDNCLLHYLLNEDTPKYEIIDLLRWFQSNTDWEIICWSGGGIDYTQRWVEKLGLDKLGVKVIVKGGEKVDIAVDDEFTTLGKVNIKV